jgi:cell wall-associated NlpC family hydrolase
MRRHVLVLICTLALAAATAATAGAHSTPQIRAAKAHAHAVLAEIGRIGKSLEATIQAYDGAKLELARVERQLQRNEISLRVARGNLRAARRRLMERLYTLYVYGQPSTLEVLAGANSISQIISRAEAAQALSSQDAALSRQALRFERLVQTRERQLRRLRRARASAVARLAAKGRMIRSAMAQQKRLLASIHSSIHQLQVQEARREARLKAIAEARLRALAAQRRAAEQAATTQAPPSSSGTVPPPVSVPVIGDPGVGHPQAAQIALQYLGVPYVWGGASPSGFDCSGLVMYVYAQLGISLPHYTVAQWNATVPVAPTQMEPGDLVFFDGLGHVGIYIGGGQFVDAPHTGSVVRIDSLGGWGGSFDGARRVP